MPKFMNKREFGLAFHKISVQNDLYLRKLEKNLLTGTVLNVKRS